MAVFSNCRLVTELSQRRSTTASLFLGVHCQSSKMCCLKYKDRCFSDSIFQHAVDKPHQLSSGVRLLVDRSTVRTVYQT